MKTTSKSKNQLFIIAIFAMISIIGKSQTKINETKVSDINIYPNPTTSLVSIPLAKLWKENQI